MFTPSSTIITVTVGPENGYPAYRAHGTIDAVPAGPVPLRLFERGADMDFLPVEWDSVPAEVEDAMRHAHHAACASIIDAGLMPEATDARDAAI
jgi:hypothetical protein